MLKTVLGVVVEVLIAMATAGLLLAVVVPLLTRRDLLGANDIPTRAVITGVLIGAVALALFRPGSVIHRRLKR
jgi:type III secretory pathway component EscR